MNITRNKKYGWNLWPIHTSIIAVLVSAGGCEAFDPGDGNDGGAGSATDGSSGESEGGDGAGAFGGYAVECCFEGTWARPGFVDPQTQSGCAVIHECIDPAAYEGGPDNADIMAFCNEKCTPAWPGNQNVEPGWDQSGAPGTFLWACKANADSHIVSKNTCTPHEPDNYGSPWNVAPDHRASFDPASTGHVDLRINGERVSAQYTLDIGFAIDDCDEDGINGGSCRILIGRFDLASTGPFAAARYEILNAHAELWRATAADVHFEPCVGDTCTGEFEFREGLDNPIGLDVLWTQRNQNTESVSVGGLHLGNDGESLGGLHAVRGTLTTDRSGALGRMRITGEGSDNLSGEFASLDFDLEGDVTPE